MRSTVLCAATILAAFALRAQDDVRPAFEVASVKECTASDRPSPSSSSPGRLGLSCLPLWRLIVDAYDTFGDGKVDPLKPLVPFPPEGFPSWVNSARYSIDAKAESPQTGAMMRGPMMQVLLEDRFQLKVHHEVKEVQGYLMTVARGGLKLKPTEEGSCAQADPTDFTLSGNTGPGGKPWCGAPMMSSRGAITVFDSHGMTLEVFARMLHPNGGVVINQTGISGRFEFHLELEQEGRRPPATADGVASDPSPHTSDIIATREQLGLQLTAGKGKHEVLVIDHVERPSGN